MKLIIPDVKIIITFVTLKLFIGWKLDFFHFYNKVGVKIRKMKK